MTYSTIDVRKHERKHPRKQNTTIPVRKHQRRICSCDPGELSKTSIMAGKPPTTSSEPSIPMKDGQFVLTQYLAPYYKESDTDSYYRFQKLPVSEARKMSTGEPNLELEDNQNSSPSTREMFDMAAKHNGTMEGYVIPMASGRDDARISVDGFTIRASKEDAQKLQRELKNKKHTEKWEGEEITWNEGPDEFDEVSPGYWRFWWD
jgi:hypothetical protein